ncbi:MAG: nucleotidyltransferase domain-containing protein [Desulfobacterales bacterium]|nr:nucleotidyltransferase domain-containing protein [Desulfobacterales bacterium]
MTPMASGKDKRLVHREVKRYISLLREQDITVIQAYLFGSYANNKADEWSDIDAESGLYNRKMQSHVLNDEFKGLLV